MKCCDWETFEESFLYVWKKDRLNPSPLLIDWRKAKAHWRSYGMTGGEAALTQLKQLKKESIYGGQCLPRSDDEPEPWQREDKSTPVTAGLIAQEFIARVMRK